MFAVLIHWKIKQTDEHRCAFLKFWREQASINNDNELIGENYAITEVIEVLENNVAEQRSIFDDEEN